MILMAILRLITIPGPQRVCIENDFPFPLSFPYGLTGTVIAATTFRPNPYILKGRQKSCFGSKGGGATLQVGLGFWVLGAKEDYNATGCRGFGFRILEVKGGSSQTVLPALHSLTYEKPSSRTWS